MTLLMSAINRVVDKAQLKFSYEMLKDLTEEGFLRSIETIIKTEKNIYPGTNIIALIREKATDDINKPLPGEAWEEIIGQVRSVGSYGTPTFSNPLIKKAMDAIGWNEICMSNSQDNIIRAHFMKIYESYAQREDSERQLGLPNIAVGFQRLLKSM